MTNRRIAKTVHRRDSRQSAIPKSAIAVPAVLSLGDSCVSIAIADPAGRPFVRDIGGGVAGESRPALAGGRLAAHGSFSPESGWAAHNDYRSMTNDSLVEDVATTLRYYAAQNGSGGSIACSSAGHGPPPRNPWSCCARE